MSVKAVFQLIAAVIACQLAGLIGSVFTFSAIPTWYAELTKPFFNPPNWIFSPVWTTLYALMGISLYLIWRKAGTSQMGKTALIIFGVQLAL
ncbi:tryptophan-rich sensory protein, partial [Candidatus Woesearchaeota archaeon]|nr:tryptophan-rich sensory protein [Candidatus Woesearchaeota archaeon]